MKPALYWAVKRETYGHRMTCMRVTSESDRAVFGSENGTPTHCRRSEILGKHDTEEAARACLAAVEAVDNEWEPRLVDLRRALNKAQDDCHQAKLRAARGIV